MDEKDSEIVRLLKRDSRLSFTKMGKRLGITEGAVRKRVQALVNSGVIKRFTIDVEDAEKIRSLQLIKVHTKVPNPQVAKAINDIRHVDRIYEIAGEYDLVILLSAPNIKGINDSIDEIRTVRGVEGTNTVLILKEWY